MSDRICRHQSVARLVRGLALGATLLATGTALPLRAQQSQAVEVEGEVEVVYEDDLNISRLHHFLHTRVGRLRLAFPSNPPDVQTGTRLRARGRLENGTLMLASSSDTQVLSLASSGTFGEQRTIVMLVTFTETSTPPYSVTHADHVTFQTVNDFYRENSYSQTSFAGDAFGWFPIAWSSTSCDTTKIASLAEQAAVAAGANLSNYTRRIYAFPYTSACPFWGRGTVGGNPSKSWINGTYSLQVVAHELGHNFGNYHSHSVPCHPGGCTTVDYGDTHDILGNRATGHMNAFQKERLGWLNYGSSPPAQVVAAPGTYWIDSFAAPGSGPKVLKILKDTDSNGRRTWYYVEARTKTGFDGTVAPGVIVRTGSEASGNTSNQIDLDPVTTAFDGLLDPGQTFSNAALGLFVTTTSAGSAGASVDVSFDAAPCAPASPTVALAPSDIVYTSPGSVISYVVGVHNNDASGCEPAAFSLSSIVPSGWSAVFTSAALVVPPGATASVGMTLTLPDSASGQQVVEASANREGSSASVSGDVVVVTSLDIALAASKTGQSFKLAATVAAGASAVAGTPVTFRITSPTGLVMTLGATTNTAGAATVSFKPGKKDPKGTYLVTATASANGLSGVGTATFVY